MLELMVLLLVITSPLPIATATGVSSCADRASGLRFGDAACPEHTAFSSSSKRGASLAATSKAISAALAGGAASFSERSRRLDGFSAKRDWQLGAALPLPGAGPVLLLLGADGPLLLGAGDAEFPQGAGDAVRWLGVGDTLPLAPPTSCPWGASADGSAGGTFAAGRGTDPDCLLGRCKCTLRTAVVSPGKISAGAPK